MEQQQLDLGHSISDTLKVHKVYVPIYSDIYLKTKDAKILLTATLSIRNTSEYDTLFVNRLDYYDSKGKLARRYIDKTIYINPLETMDYVIEEKDSIGGSGANFIIEWRSKKALKPLFQSVMVGSIGNKSFAFATDGVSIE
jgi:hypothetical protein